MLENTNIYTESFWDDCYYVNKTYNKLFDYDDVTTYKTGLTTSEAEQTVKDNGDYKAQNEKELKTVENYTATDSFDFLETWFKYNCVN